MCLLSPLKPKRIDSLRKLTFSVIVIPLPFFVNSIMFYILSFSSKKYVSLVNSIIIVVQKLFPALWRIFLLGNSDKCSLCNVYNVL